MFGGTNKIRVMIPTYQLVPSHETNNNRSYTVYKIEVVCDGKVTVTEKRYSEFYALFKKLSKLSLKIPFPPKRMLHNKEEKLVESRREGLEKYLKAVLHAIQDDVPEVLLKFLSIPQYYDQIESNENFDERDSDNVYIHAGVQRPTNSMICFRKEVYLVPTMQELEEEKLLPSIVLSGCLDGIYKSH